MVVQNRENTLYIFLINLFTAHLPLEVGADYEILFLGDILENLLENFQKILIDIS